MQCMKVFVFILILLISQTVLSASTLSLPASVDTSRGKYLTLPVALQNADDITVLQFDIAFDAAKFSIIKALPSNSSSGLKVLSRDLGVGQMRVVVTPAVGLTALATGDLVTLELYVLPTTVSGTSSVSILGLVASDTNVAKVNNVALVPSVLTIKIDTDMDGIPNEMDDDMDGDNIVNAQDADMDGDGIDNVFELVNGLNQADDADATLDLDGDGLSNLIEYQIGTQLSNNDSDSDGLPDGWEWQNQLDPLNGSDALLDFDGDGLLNSEEFLHGTNPNDIDSDGDGMSDRWEVDNGLDPTTNLDQLSDPDGDSLANSDEYIFGTDPNNYDTDNDGASDGEEVALGRNPLLSEPAVILIINELLLEN